MMFKKLSKYDNLFLEQESMELYRLVNGEMQPLQHDAVIGFKRNDLSNAYPKEESELKDFIEEYVEAFEDGQGNDTSLYRKANKLLRK